MNSTEQPAVECRLDGGVRPHSGDWMLPREAERLVALWCAGQPLDDLPQWRTAMQVLMRELSDTRSALKRANDKAERYAGICDDEFRVLMTAAHEGRIDGDIAGAGMRMSQCIKRRIRAA